MKLLLPRPKYCFDCLFACSVSATVYAQTAAELIELEFEDLVSMSVEVESAGKSKARAMDLPYAAYVISSEDIASSGATHIADALGLAPGVAVDRISTSEWAVSIRGSGGRFSKFVLVLIDGRIVFNTVFSGVNWDELNLSLLNVDRIEVIRGPNAAAWGANAVNGIINIITRKPLSEQGALVQGLAGDGGRRQLTARFNVPVGEWSLGFSGHMKQQDGFENSLGFEEGQAKGARISTSLHHQNDEREVFATADVYSSEQEPLWGWVNDSPPSTPMALNPEQKHGASVQLLYKYQFNQRWQGQLRAAIDDSRRNTYLYDWDSTHYQLDMDFFGEYQKHSISAGASTRISDSAIYTAPEFNIVLNPERRTVKTYGVYASDVWELSEPLQVTFSARADYNELSGDVHLQPSLRALWRKSASERYWMALSRASATTARALTDIDHIYYGLFPAQPPEQLLPVIIDVVGHQDDVRDSQVTSLEVGYRRTFNRASIDVSAFKFKYKNDATVLFSSEPELQFDQNFVPTYILQRGIFANNEDFSSTGLELNSHFKFNSTWSGQFNYSYLDTQTEVSGWGHIIYFVNSFQLNDALEFNWALRYKENNIVAAVEGYTQSDVNVQWQVSETLQLKLSANNLGDKHSEAVRDQFPVPPLLISPYGLLTVNYSF